MFARACSNFSPLAIFAFALFASVRLSFASGECILKVGTTIPEEGLNAVVGVEIQTGIQAWFSLFNSTFGGVVVVNGTSCRLELVTYNDASDPELQEILVDRLVHFDKVDVLMPPWITPADFAARNWTETLLEYQLPVLNSAALVEVWFPGIDAALAPWVITTIPSVLQYGAACGSILLEANIHEVLFVSDQISDVTGLSAQLLQSLGNLTVLKQYMLPSPTTNSSAADLIDAMVDEWQTYPGVGWFGSVVDTPTAQLLRQRALLKRYQPPSFTMYLVLSDPSARKQLGWQAAWLTYGAIFSSALNFSDLVLGSPAQFEQAYVQMFNRSASDISGSVASGLSVLVDALQRATSTNSTAIRDALLSTNTTTITGPTLLDQFSRVLRPCICLQLQADGVTPALLTPLFGGSQNNSVQKFVTPLPPPNYPPGFFPSSSNDQAALIGGIAGGVGGLLVLLLLAGIVWFLLRRRYHVLFIEKEARKEEAW